MLIFKEKNISAHFFDNSLSKKNEKAFREGTHKAKFLILTPEKFHQNQLVKNLIFEMN